MPENTLDKLKKLTAWDSEPALTEGELTDLIVTASLLDNKGLAPEAENWSPTYDLNQAAAQAWLIKAARAASLTEVEGDIVTSKVFDNCRKMVWIFSNRRASSVPISMR